MSISVIFLNCDFSLSAWYGIKAHCLLYIVSYYAYLLQMHNIPDDTIVNITPMKYVTWLLFNDVMILFQTTFNYVTHVCNYY